MPDSSGFPKEFDRYLKQRVVFMGTPIDETIAKLVMAQMIYLAKEDARKPIYFLVDSPGGLVVSALAIYDLLRHSKPPIHTHCIKQASGMAALLVAAGTKGHRTSAKESRFQMTPLRGQDPNDPKFKINLEVIESQVADQFALATGREITQILEDMSQESIMVGEEAVTYGLVDRIVSDIPGLQRAHHH